uniref:Uncharacterized protein n=1 Tax=Asparagus officinalis TaxID=4686 RepID=Q2XNT0_ASPOF|nr:hypothetical protein 12.t00004 [Asparagus officinalis]ABB55342.1 hypothetical protein 9.t00003 [Asparagus officinalis]
MQRSFIGLLLAWDLCLCRGLSADHRRSDLIAKKLGRASLIREGIKKPASPTLENSRSKKKEAPGAVFIGIKEVRAVKTAQRWIFGAGDTPGHLSEAETPWGVSFVPRHLGVSQLRMRRSVLYICPFPP